MTMDIANLVVDIPSIVEGFVKTARAVVAYQELETKYAETLKDAIYYAEKLAYLSRFIEGAQIGGGNKLDGVREPSMWSKSIQRVVVSSRNNTSAASINEDILSVESQKILYELFQKADSTLRVAQKVVLEWAIRLDLIDSSSSRVLFARLAISMSDRFFMHPGVREKRRPLSKARSKLSFLALGFIQVEDAVTRLKHWLAELHDILLISPNLRLSSVISKLSKSEAEGNEGDDLLYVGIARQREMRSYAVQQVEDDFSLVGQVLGNGNQELFLIQEGMFEGCLLDRRNVLHFLEQGKIDQALEDTIRMARLFAEEHDDLGHNITASVGILPCCGFSTSTRGYHDLIFRLPYGCQTPRTLRSLLMEEPRHTLNERLDFSIKLATSLLIVHSLGLVHKDIRPDSVVVIRSALIQDSGILPQALGEPYLVSFNQSRSQSSITVPMAEGIREARSRLWKALYRHPRHLSTRQHLPHETRDDVYSLGICLLEIAIWKSLFAWNMEHGVFDCDKSVLDFSANKYQKELEGCQTWTLVRPVLRQRDLIKFAEQRVPITMGTAFKDIVVECLTFCDEATSAADMIEKQKDNQNFLQKQAVNFVQHVLTKLRNLRLE